MSTTIFFAVVLLITVLTVSCAPILPNQNGATDSNAYKNAIVVSPYLNRAVRLVDFSSPYQVDDDADLPSESDIFYVFGKYSDVTDDRKSSGL